MTANCLIASTNEMTGDKRFQESFACDDFILTPRSSSVMYLLIVAARSTA